MPQVVNAGMSSPGDLKTLGARTGATKPVRGQNGQTIQVAASNLDQQRMLVAQILKETRRSTSKYITAKFTSAGDGKKWVLGNALGLSADESAAEITETYQNKGGASGSAAAKTAFKNFINSMPFRYVGVKVEVSDKDIFNNSFTELINDVDNNCNQEFQAVVDAGQNIYSQEPTTRLLNIAGEFNGCWGLYSTLDNTEWIKFSFNCVDIQRSW